MPRPGELEEKKKHIDDKKRFQDVIRKHQVDLIVVAADCLEAKKLKKTLDEFANLKNHGGENKDGSESEDERGMEDGNFNEEAIVIWGRPEIPRLFAQSHYS
jgi:hypothetical protein